MVETPETEKKTTWKLSEEQWTEACRMYEVDDAKLVDIADKFSITRQALSARFKTNGIIRGSKVPKPEAPAARVDRFIDQREKWIEETRVEGYTALRQASLVMRKIFAEQIKTSSASGKTSVAAIEDEVRTMNRLIKGTSENMESRLKMLNADEHMDEDDLPALSVEDITDEEILEHHKSTGAFDESMTIEEMLQEEEDLGREK